MKQNKTKQQIHVLVSTDIKQELDDIYYEGEFISFSTFIQSVLELGLKEYRR